MKITGTRSCILIEYNHRFLKIKGELTMTSFYAKVNSIDCWEPPFENIRVTDEEKIALVNMVEEAQKKDSSRFKIVFED